MAHFLEHGIEQRHVGFLGLDRMAEEGVGLVGQQGVDGHLFDSQNERRFTQVLLDDRACLDVLLLATNSHRLPFDHNGGKNETASNSPAFGKLSCLMAEQ